MKKLKILHLSSLAIWDIEAGKGRVSTYLPLKGMVESGHDLIFISSSTKVITGNYDGIMCKRIWVPTAKMRSLFQFIFAPLSDIYFFIAGVKAARKCKPDIVYAHCVISAVPAYWISKMYGAKFVLRLYGVGKGAINKWRHFPSYMLLRRCLHINADAFILTNDGTAADKFAKRFGVPDEKIFFLKNGIKKDVDLTPDEYLRKDIAPNGESIVISVSRLSNWKQVDIIIKMMPELLKMTPVKLIIIGDGDQRDFLHNLAVELGVKESVLFLGAKKHDEVYRYLNIADVFVSMNYLSSMSNPVFEAMLCCKPVIALNKGTTTDLIHDGENGILIEPQELGILPRKVNELLSNEEQLRKIGENARRYLMEQWPTWEERTNHEIRILESL